MKQRHRKDADGPQRDDESIEAGDKTDSDEGSEISIDFSKVTSGISSFFKKVDAEVLVVAAFVLFCMVLVFTVRMLPLALPVTDDWAASTLQQNIRNNIGAQIDQQYPALPPANRDALIAKQVDDLIAQNKAQYDKAASDLSLQFKDGYRYTGEDGKQYTYLGDLDSYFWIRYTRNILRHGYTCDVVTPEGQCRDTYTIAPQGAPSSFNPSLHVFAIFVLYKVITIFQPHYPLPASSYFIPVIFGVLAVIPAFFIGRRLAGNVGGLFAAVLISIHPLVLSRSLGSDQDIWNIILPLCMMWMTIEALEAKSTKKIIIFASLAAIFNALHYAAWDSAWFIYLIILFGLIGYLGFVIIAELVKKRKDIWHSERVRHAALILAVFYVVNLILIILFPATLQATTSSYLQAPFSILTTHNVINRAVTPDFWPNVLTTVAELNKSNLSDAINSMGGKTFFFISLCGLLLMLLPRKGWKLLQYGLFVVGAGISLYLINNAGVGQFTALALLALPIAIMVIAQLFREEKVDMAASFIVLVWFMATLFATYSGVRFITFMVPAFGMGFAVFAGRAYEWISDYAAKEIKWHRYITNVIVFGLIALLLIQPIKAGTGTARSYIPSIDDPWWDSLSKINQESKPDAILNSWWDFGHWFKYVADRRVSADGTSQHTHVPRWLGLSLVTSDERESVGALRMLDCGSDAFPNPEGNNGAYGQIVRKVNDSVKAEQMVRDIIILDKTAARKYLAAKGFTQAEQDGVLNASHCDPPEDYYITSNDMIGKAGVWAHFGLWNFTKAYIAQRSRTLPHDEAVADLQSRFGMTQEEADKLYFDAKALSSEGEINQFAAPWPGYITGSWVACTMAPNNTALVCPLGISIGQQGAQQTAIDSFTYNITAPNASRMTYGFYQNSQRVGINNDVAPQIMVLAFPDRMQDVKFNTGSTSTGIAILVDVPNKRILVTDPAVVKSVFTQLYYLDGRYSKYYEKFDERSGFTGTRVVVWKVNWDGKKSSSSSSSSSATTFVTPKTT